ncbi:hypothetical protein OUZ56_014657 [Daphnia magna]|uniref:Uncharacterized protein n=1 Tax=Daphnia magna TaxID=35525 RepID=A0ABR0AKF6_9CRUS|nr:hypothetical protein OUZ56_014657 [Daphnia magna]
MDRDYTEQVSQIDNSRELKEIALIKFFKPFRCKNSSFGFCSYIIVVQLVGTNCGTAVPSNDIPELEDPHVPFPDSALTTADHSRGMTPYGLITSQGETGLQKRREPRYALQFIKILKFHLRDKSATNGDVKESHYRALDGVVVSSLS